MEDTKHQDTTEEVEQEADAPKRFTLDTVVEDEGSNLSVGQRSLVSLARALVKESRVLILDEATGMMNFALIVMLRKTDPSPFYSLCRLRD